MRRNLTNSVRELMRTFGHPFDPYRPELHYMRGPGPKCQAKQVSLVASASPVPVESVVRIGEIAEAHA